MTLLLGPINRPWAPIVDRARELHAEEMAATGLRPTLRRLFYLLVSDAPAVALGFVNVHYDYKYLSGVTAKGRRDGSFPDLSESGREINVPWFVSDAEELARELLVSARADRWAGQEKLVLVGVEKVGMRPLLGRMVNRYGIWTFAAEGYTSQTQIDRLARMIFDDGRDAVVLYFGDLDPSGEDIQRDLEERLGVADVVRVAVLPEHIEQFGLVRSPFDKEDARAKQFLAKHGALFQVEIDAVPVAALQPLLDEALEPYLDRDVWQAAVDSEQQLLDDAVQFIRDGGLDEEVD